jgi:hypothetical protein
LSINSLRVKMPGRLRSDGGRRAVSPWPCAIWPASSYQQFMLETGLGNVARVFVRVLRSDAVGRRGTVCSNVALCSGTPWTCSEPPTNLLRPERWSLRCSRPGASLARRQSKCGISMAGCNRLCGTATASPSCVSVNVRRCDGLFVCRRDWPPSNDDRSRSGRGPPQRPNRRRGTGPKEAALESASGIDFLSS